MIAIIAVLASLLLPALKTARVAAYRSNCVSNARQSLVALNVYASDYNEFPFNMDTNSTAVVDAVYGFTRAPWSNGAEGNKSHWRGWLILLGYSPSTVLGCSDSLLHKPASVSVFGAQQADNFVESPTDIRRTPPYTYLGPGTDTERVAGYNSGILGPPGSWGDDAASREGRSYRWSGRHPLLICPYFRQGSNLMGVPVIAPHSGGLGFNGQQMDWSDRAVDQNVGWTDGSVSFVFGHASGMVGDAVYFPLPDYNWAEH